MIPVSDISSDQPQIFVAGGNGPYQNTASLLQKFDLSFAKGKRVLLKPNLGRSAKPDTGIITNPMIIAAAIDAFQKAGAKVAVGESPIVGVNINEAFEESGLSLIAEKRNCRLIDLDKRGCVKIPVNNGIVLEFLQICKDVIESDIIVSIPVMKMHMHTGVTLSLKNMKGCLWKKSKVKLHMLPPVKGYDEKPINIAISDLAEILMPDFAIIDGTVGMEGLGPSAGTPKPMDVVVAGFDPFAADAVACRLMGTDAKEIPHLRLGAKRGFGIIDIDKISIFPKNWKEMASVFEPPPKNLTFEFPNIKIYDKKSCSACQSTILLLLKRDHDKITDSFPKNKQINIVIGKGNIDIPSDAFCIGNCTSIHKKNRIFIQGCPPVVSEILKKICNHSDI